MATLIQLTILIISTTLFSTAISTIPPSDHHHQLSLLKALPPLLSRLGFQQLSLAAPFLKLDPHTSPRALTIFAPSDSSLGSCLSCSIPQLLQEHILFGHYPLRNLLPLPFGFKLQTIFPGHCLSLEISPANKLFVGGVEVTRPNLFDNGIIVIHGVDGYISRLTSFSCNAEHSSSAIPTAISTVPKAGALLPAGSDDSGEALYPVRVMGFMLNEATLRLRVTGFSVLAFALKVNYRSFLHLKNMTVFALDDGAAFSAGHVYVDNINSYIVPDMYLRELELENLKEGTEIPTLAKGKRLKVTSAGKGKLRINNAEVKNLGFLSNLKMVFHQVYQPLF